MKKQGKPTYKIKIRDIGPIADLDSPLSDKPQNLIFASNGKGKSFLSRTFRYIAEHNNQENQETIADLLVSKESLVSGDGSAEFIFSSNKGDLAKLKITKQDKNPIPEIKFKTIFHVFSQDFIDTELREVEYKLHEKTFKETILGIDNIKLKEARKKFEESEIDCAEEERLLAVIFNREKELKLKNKLDSRRYPDEYITLSIKSYFTKNVPSKLPKSGRYLNDIIIDINKLELIPANPSLPEDLVQLSLKEIPLTKIQDILKKSISPSGIGGDIQDEIDANRDFFKVGVSLIDKKPGTCPLCKQSLKNDEVKEIIRTYVKYFEKAEAKAKEELEQYEKVISKKIKEIKSHEQNTTRQEKSFNDLKQYISSQKETSFENTDDDYKKIINILTEIKDIVNKKCAKLSDLYAIPDRDLDNILEGFNCKIRSNNNKIEIITNRYKKRTTERLDLRKELCKAFIPWFAEKYKTEIKKINAIKLNLEEQETEIKRLEDANANNNAKGRLAITFKSLLNHIFGTKYSFDEKRFTIKMNKGDMPRRGSHRTLSDGEKSVMAFCYFIAMIHQKVEEENDYEKLFLVFDDPVTSMSYDFVYFIVQALRNLRILNEGEISITHRQKGDTSPRPRFLILTHNSYFFNVAYTNGVVKPTAAFLLDTSDGKHKLLPSNEYIAPFKEQLKDVILVADGKKPDHTTANSIRSVLEAIQRFCCPDMELNDFFGYLEQEKKIEIKSTLIQNFSHGRPDETQPPQDQLKQACEDLKKIAKEFMPGRNYEINTQIPTNT